MNDRKTESKLNEPLSAFLDGETSTEETHALLEQLLRDPQMQQAINRHQRLRASLHGELHPGLDDDFAGRVMAGIEQAENGTESRHIGKVITLKMPRLRPVVRTAVGMAMAASLAAVAVLGVQMLLPSSDTAFPAMTTAGIPASVPAPTDALELAGDIDTSQQWDDLSPDAAAELNNYLISHNNSAIDHGLNGTLGFMRVAADDELDYSGTEP
jgi:sigma-E factor negative regulatory protein RseA